jgi:hypothetical protein
MGRDVSVGAFIPMLPDLDHDIDLTTNQDPALPATPSGGHFGAADPTAAP